MFRTVRFFSMTAIAMVVLGGCVTTPDPKGCNSAYNDVEFECSREAELTTKNPIEYRDTFFECTERYGYDEKGNCISAQ